MPGHPYNYSPHLLGYRSPTEGHTVPTADGLPRPHLLTTSGRGSSATAISSILVPRLPRSHIYRLASHLTTFTSKIYYGNRGGGGPPKSLKKTSTPGSRRDLDGGRYALASVWRDCNVALKCQPIFKSQSLCFLQDSNTICVSRVPASNYSFMRSVGSFPAISLLPTLIVRYTVAQLVCVNGSHYTFTLPSSRTCEDSGRTTSDPPCKAESNAGMRMYSGAILLFCRIWDRGAARFLPY
ncbi:hypothetical protein R3P38DRAFT_3459789 [Favolaschia claudopus]|uniref:Uncharacterized protein n=1 Tax=Favolaschia claudopus TaxID=2862362 RepID=A0AAV9ZI27_9AGAR